MKLEAFLPLLSITDFDFYSLQVGDHNAGIEEAGLSSDLNRFIAAAHGFLRNGGRLSPIDLLIAVDTAAVHVAGALGRPVWAIIPFAPDWRWGLEGDATAWYQSAELWRQPEPQYWESIIARLSDALAPQAKRKGRRKS